MSGRLPAVVRAMRALAALGFVIAAAGPVAAEDKSPDTLVKALADGPLSVWAKPMPEAWVTPPVVSRSGAPAFGGGWALGQIVVPADHPDMVAPPRGMVYAPPDVGDRMAIEPGGSGLGRWEPRSYTGKFAQGLADGLTKAFQLVVPKHL
jgi:hypothetical protein